MADLRFWFAEAFLAECVVVSKPKEYTGWKGVNPKSCLTEMAFL